MQGYITIKDGWVQEVHACEMGINYNTHVAAGDIPVGNPDVLRKIMQCQPIMFWDGNQWRQVKDPRNIWKRIRLNGLPSSAYADLINSLDPSFPDVPAENVATNLPLVKKIFDPDFVCELKPGLKVELSNEDDIEIWEKSMVDSGLYTSQEAIVFAQSWLSDPMTWPVKVTWKGKPLQIELHQLGIGNTLIGGFTAHLDRTRPRWFWKQTALPVLKALYGHGFETINEQVRIDKPHYAEFLSDTYGHKILRSSDKYINLKLDIETAISKIGPWPTRRTMGADWKWERDGILIREANDADIPAINQAIETSWGDNPRKQLAISNFEVQWNLDNAAILLVFEGGVTTEVRTFRERRDPTVNLRNNLLRTAKDTKIKTTSIGIDEWQKAVGYKTTTFIIETNLVGKMTWLTEGWATIDHEGYIECRKNLL